MCGVLLRCAADAEARGRVGDQKKVAVVTFCDIKHEIAGVLGIVTGKIDVIHINSSIKKIKVEAMAIPLLKMWEIVLIMQLPDLR